MKGSYVWISCIVFVTNRNDYGLSYLGLYEMKTNNDRTKTQSEIPLTNYELLGLKSDRDFIVTNPTLQHTTSFSSKDRGGLRMT